ncbi:unnamed protein product [Lymnaea stagnalis]|uniref:Phospholipid-transporting ATPase n=1 Tax=Lymnaea stagnalis TaxID=6523 RepID=A0AAV2HH32_LYMST
MEVTMRDEMKKYKLLHSLPFDPTRKRMSVIIEDVSGKVANPKGGRTKAGREELAANDNRKIFLLCKGADVAIMDRVVAGDIESTQKMIDLYAELGLRTLSITQRSLSMEEFLYFDKELMEAKRTLENREKKLSALYGEIEQNLTLLGATAVEDKLQHEVPQTIEALRLAGIKVWVLTGDKEETAVNISHSAGHFNKEMLELRLTQVHSDEQCEEQLKQLIQSTTLCSPDTQHALIIDGQSLHWAMKKHMDWLLQLCLKCVAVLCCRMSPIQKAEIVAMVKRSKGHPVTAAIGDGANDVSMIQEADVGFGIMGKEGRQAVRNSDYAFGKFRFLRRAILLHGHFYYNRIAVLVQYFFYKNVAWITGQLLYAIFNGWSSQSLYDAFYLVFYNLTFTSLPILIYGLFEQHKSKEVLLNNPSLYRKITRNATLSWDQFLKWNLLGVWHCCVIFFGIYLLQKDGVSMFKSGETIGNYDYGSLIHFSCVTTVNVKLMIETYYWCIATSFAYLITYAGIIVLVAVYTNLFWPSSISSDDLYKAIAQLFSGPVPWLAMILVIILALIPDILIRVCKDIRFTHMKIDRYKEKRKKSFALVNRQAQVVSTSNGQRQQEVDKPLHKVTESIELKDRPNGTTKHSRLHGYVNTAMTMSSEDIPSATLANSEPGPPNSSHSTTSSPGANGMPSRKLSTDSCDSSIIATHFTTKASFTGSSPSHIVHTVDLHLQDPLSHVNSNHPSSVDTPNPVASQTALVVDIHTDDVHKSSDNNESTLGSRPDNTSFSGAHAQHDNNIPVPVDEVTYSNSHGYEGLSDTGTLPPHHVTTIQVKGGHVDQQATAATAVVDSLLPHDIRDGLSFKAQTPNANDALSLNATSLHNINDVQSLNVTNSHDIPSSVHSSPSHNVVVNLEPLQHPEPINKGSDCIREITKL